MNIEYLGNKRLLDGPLVAFLAPSRVSPLAVLPTLDWASTMSHSQRTVVSGFSSRLEREVLAVLRRGSSPVVMVTARSRYHIVPPDLQPLLDEGRLLVVSLGLGIRQNRRNAQQRNAYVAAMAGELVMPSVDASSSLFPIYKAALAEGKAVTMLGQEG